MRAKTETNKNDAHVTDFMSPSPMENPNPNA